MSLSQTNSFPLFISKKHKDPSSIFKVTKKYKKRKTIEQPIKTVIEIETQLDLNETVCDSIPKTPLHTSIEQIIIPSFFNDKPKHTNIKETLEQYEKVVNCFDDEERELYLMRKESLLSDITSASSNCDW